ACHHVHLGAGLPFQHFTHLFGIHALGAPAVHFQDAVTGLDAIGHGRIAFVRFAHHHPLVLLPDHGPDAPVLPGGHDAIVLHIAFGDVLRVGVQACEHGVYAGPDELSGLHIVHIVDVDVLVELVEDLQVLPHLEVVVARRYGEGASEI